MSSNVNRPFYLFRTIVDTAFMAIIGSFVFLAMVFFSMACIFLSPLHNQLTLFLTLGAIFFSCAWRLFITRHGERLRNLTFGGYLTSRRVLISYLAWSLSNYLMLCWLILFLLGIFHGFHWAFPDNSQTKALLLTNALDAKRTALILWVIHVTLIFIVRLLLSYWKNLFAYAHREFERRRRNLEAVRSQARETN